MSYCVVFLASGQDRCFNARACKCDIDVAQPWDWESGLQHVLFQIHDLDVAPVAGSHQKRKMGWNGPRKPPLIDADNCEFEHCAFSPRLRHPCKLSAMIGWRHASQIDPGSRATSQLTKILWVLHNTDNVGFAQDLLGRKLSGKSWEEGSPEFSCECPLHDPYLPGAIMALQAKLGNKHQISRTAGAGELSLPITSPFSPPDRRFPHHQWKSKGPRGLPPFHSPFLSPPSFTPAFGQVPGFVGPECRNIT